MPVTLESIPVGSTLRRDLDGLAPPALARALAALSAATFASEDLASLHADPDGGIFYSCALAPAAPLNAEPAPGVDPDIPLAATVPIDTPPVRHSRPGCAKVIYLDFNGAVVSGTAWNNASGVAAYDCRPFDMDGDPAQFNDAEQAAIIEIWRRVSEDYAPFDVDITTEAPATFTNTTAHALVTSPKDRNNVDLPSANAAGVAYLNVFGKTSYAYNRPAFIYYTALPTGGTPYPGMVAEAVSHEVGHNMGLSHDGQTGGPEYYSGHGSGDTSWAPIMGSSYTRNVTQWSKGEYYKANNTQDDLAILDGKLTRRADDLGDTTDTALLLANTGTTLSAPGLMQSVTDSDIFRFLAGRGTLTVTVSPYHAPTRTRGGNSDLKLELLGASGVLLATADPADKTTATLSTVITEPGTYYARISTTGTGTPTASAPTGYTAYGSIGEYTLDLTRTLDLGTPPAVIQSPSDIVCLPGGSAQFSARFSGDPVPDLAWQFFDNTVQDWVGVTNDPIHQGATAGILQLTSVPATFNGRRYRCVGTNGSGPSAVTTVAVLTVGFSWPAYQAAFFTPAELSDPALSGPEADPDNDGLDNLLEYAFARDPRNAEPSAPLAFTGDGTTPTFTFTQPHSAADLTYSLQRSSDLQTWTTVADADYSRTTTALSSEVDQVELQFIAPTGADRQFYRLRVQLP